MEVAQLCIFTEWFLGHPSVPSVYLPSASKAFWCPFWGERQQFHLDSVSRNQIRSQHNRFGPPRPSPWVRDKWVAANGFFYFRTKRRSSFKCSLFQTLFAALHQLATPYMDSSPSLLTGPADQILLFRKFASVESAAKSKANPMAFLWYTHSRSSFAGTHLHPDGPA